jgi:drug/metabolite transporter (DMT)-like permease
MEVIWIPLSVFAALMQAIRTAAQKTLNQTMSTMGTTYVRSLFGLPFIALFLAGLLYLEGGGVPSFSRVFLAFAFGGALSQALGTALLIHMFSLKSFAVGTMLTKSDILLTALVGSALFSERITAIGWIGLLVMFGGVLLMLVGKLELRTLVARGDTRRFDLFGRVTQVALMCALMFTMSYLCFREATLILQPGGFLWRGTWTVLVGTGMQTIFLGAWLLIREPGVFHQLWPNRRLISFIGMTSALGSIGWFGAFALQNASYVRAVGQIESLFTLAISWGYFREKITRLELLGMMTMVVGVLMFRVVK